MRQYLQGLDYIPNFCFVFYQESNQRNNKIGYSSNDLNKYENEGGTFKQWLEDAERQLANAKRNVPEDYEALKHKLDEQKEFTEDVNDRKGDLKFINMTGQKFLDNAKVSLVSCKFVRRTQHMLFTSQHTLPSFLYCNSAYGSYRWY